MEPLYTVISMPQNIGILMHKGSPTVPDKGISSPDLRLICQ